MPPFTTCLWFDKDAEQAVSFYTSIFKDSKIEAISRYGDSGPGQPGSVMTIVFEMNGQQFMALNGGPEYSFTPAISFVVYCETQAEIDYYWDRLTAGGQEVQCGWLTDKFGISWQVVPTTLGQLMSDPDGEKVSRLTEAMLKMVKLDIAGLQAAYAG